jgi:hypothetical protein
MEFKSVDELPSPLVRGRGRALDPILAEFAEALKEQKGRWFVFPKPVKDGTRKSYVALINKGDGEGGGPSALCTGEFEAAVRTELVTNEKGEEEPNITLYVRARLVPKVPKPKPVEEVPAEEEATDGDEVSDVVEPEIEDAGVPPAEFSHA